MLPHRRVLLRRRGGGEQWSAGRGRPTAGVGGLPHSPACHQGAISAWPEQAAPTRPRAQTLMIREPPRSSTAKWVQQSGVGAAHAGGTGPRSWAHAGAREGGRAPLTSHETSVEAGVPHDFVLLVVSSHLQHLHHQPALWRLPVHGHQRRPAGTHHQPFTPRFASGHELCRVRNSKRDACQAMQSDAYAARDLGPARSSRSRPRIAGLMGLVPPGRATGFRMGLTSWPSPRRSNPQQFQRPCRHVGCSKPPPLCRNCAKTL